MLELVHVNHQFIAPRERPVTNFTNVRLLAGVNPHVNRQLVLPSKTLPANRTLEDRLRGTRIIVIVCLGFGCALLGR